MNALLALGADMVLKNYSRRTAGEVSVALKDQVAEMRRTIIMYGCFSAASILAGTLLLRVFYLWLESETQPQIAMLIVAGASLMISGGLVLWQRRSKHLRKLAAERDHNS